MIIVAQGAAAHARTINSITISIIVTNYTIGATTSIIVAISIIVTTPALL